MHTLLILGAGRNQVPAIETAKRIGLRVIAIDPAPDAPGFAAADEWYVNDLGDGEACLTIAAKCRVDGAMTIAAEYPIPALAYVCDRLDLLGVRPSAATRATNKREMRAAFAIAGVPCPMSRHVTAVESAISAVHELGGRTIVKPVVGNGKKGITSLGSAPSEKSIRRAFDRAFEFTRGDGVLVEECVDGPEFSVEALTFSGNTHVVAITSKSTSGDPYFVEIGHVLPAQISSAEAHALCNVACAAVAAIGIDNSPSHTEVRLSSKGPQVIEIGARLGGGFITSHLVPLSKGVNLVEASIRVALGQAANLTPTKHAAAVIQFLTATPGLVRAVEGLAECRALPGVNEVAVYVVPGESVRPLVDNSCRVGHVICVDESPETAVKLAADASRRIKIVTVGA